MIFYSAASYSISSWNENTYREELFKERFNEMFNLAVFPFYWPGYESKSGIHALGRHARSHRLVQSQRDYHKRSSAGMGYQIRNSRNGFPTTLKKRLKNF